MVRGIKIALIPARGGSKRFSRQNIRSFAGKPLIDYSIEAALKSGKFNKVVVSSDSSVLSHCARILGADALERPQLLSSDDASSSSVVIHFLSGYPQCEWFALLQPTAPLRSVVDTRNAVDFYGGGEIIESVVAVSQLTVHFQGLSLATSESKLVFLAKFMNMAEIFDENSQYVYVNGSIYTSRSDRIREGLSLVDHDSHCPLGPKIRPIDIDDEIDWVVGEALAEKRQLNGNNFSYGC
ncbi:hypothetical protein OAC78_04880 [Litorivicinus sp.]|nr:hypothetical protein [Litorivicinus sp.]